MAVFSGVALHLLMDRSQFRLSPRGSTSSRPRSALTSVPGVLVQADPDTLDLTPKPWAGIGPERDAVPARAHGHGGKGPAIAGARARHLFFTDSNRNSRPVVGATNAGGFTRRPQHRRKKYGLR